MDKAEAIKCEVKFAAQRIIVNSENDEHIKKEIQRISELVMKRNEKAYEALARR